jgi:redox-sensitive bicupin YhaK (pirin superfamily)
MFPLTRRDEPNPLELFQIWLNLPASNKFSAPYFSMFWADSIPCVRIADEGDRATYVTLIAGALGDHAAPTPPPDSWASRADADLAIWTIRMAPHAKWTLPRAHAQSNRALYFFSGSSIRVAGETVRPGSAAELFADRDVLLENGDREGEILLLQGRPIGEPVAQYGPFVMNTQQEIQQAFMDYRRTLFGGWPWDTSAPVHPRTCGRFAKHADGRVEEPTEAPAPTR